VNADDRGDSIARAVTAGEALARADWSRLEQELDAEGHAWLPGVLDDAQVRALRAGFAAARSAASLFDDAPAAGGLSVPLVAPWPGFLLRAQQGLARGLAPIAARWRAFLEGARAERPEAESGGRADALRVGGQATSADPFARSHVGLLRAGEWRPLQSVADEDARHHPFMLVALLSAPGRDFTGGELVLTERRPRMQSRPIVLPLRQGDAVLVAAGPRPCRGTQGIYRAHVRQAVGRVRSGERLGLWLRLDGR
jgi:hypothetical protein